MFNEINEMLLFAAVGRTGSITRAGKALGLPKSTVSRRISALEERLGNRLFLTSSRKLVLTDAGQALLERCQRLADEADDALAFASELTDQPAGLLRVTMPPDLGHFLLAAPIATFAARYPRISLHIDESQRFVDLATERIDVAIRGGTQRDSTLVARPLTTLTLGLFASPSYLARTATPHTPADLADHTFIILEGRTRFDRYPLHANDRRVDIDLPGTTVVTSTRMQLELAVQGLGLIVIPERFCADLVASHRLVRLLPDWTSGPHPLWLVTPSRRLLPRKTVLFLDHMTTAFTP